MKKVLLFLIVISFYLTANAQDKKPFKKGDQIIYFDGNNWIDSEIVAIGQDDMCSVYEDETKSKVIWVKKEFLELSITQVIGTTEGQNKPVVTQKYKVGDKIEYLKGSEWIKSEIFQVGEADNYKVFTDSNMVALILVNENIIRTVNSTIVKDQPIEVKKQEVIESKKEIEYKAGDFVSVFDGTNWIKSRILQINKSTGTFQVYINSENTITKWVELKDIK